MRRHVLNLIRLALAAAVFYSIAFAGNSAEMQVYAVIALVVAIGFEAVFWVTLFRGRGRGHVRVDSET